MREHRKAGTLLVPGALLSAGRRPALPVGCPRLARGLGELVLGGAPPYEPSWPLGPEPGRNLSPPPLACWSAVLDSRTSAGSHERARRSGTGWHRALQAFFPSGPRSPLRHPLSSHLCSTEASPGRDQVSQTFEFKLTLKKAMNHSVRLLVGRQVTQRTEEGPTSVARAGRPNSTLSCNPELPGAPPP